MSRIRKRSEVGPVEALEGVRSAPGSGEPKALAGFFSRSSAPIFFSGTTPTIRNLGRGNYLHCPHASCAYACHLCILGKFYGSSKSSCPQTPECCVSELYRAYFLKTPAKGAYYFVLFLHNKCRYLFTRFLLLQPILKITVQNPPDAKLSTEKL